MNDRREPRIDATLPVVAPGLDEPCVTKNVSLGGLFLMTTKRYPVGEHVNLQLRYRSLDIDIEARVTHLQSDGVGFAFVNATGSLRDTIRALIDEVLQGAHRGDGPTFFWSLDGSERLAAPTSNLTASGIVIAGTAPAPGTTVYIFLPAYTPRESETPSEIRGCKARVVEATDGGFRVEWKNPSAEFRMAISELL